MSKILEVNNLKVSFGDKSEKFFAVDGVSFCLEKGKILALVGESGSGKSVSAMSVLRLGGGKIEDGKILFRDDEREQDLLSLSSEKLRRIRGNRISVIFQEPMTCLNPVMTVMKQLREPFMLHAGRTKKQATVSALNLLSSVHIQGAERVAKGYPHQLSGGMRQRVMIAMALAAKPKVLIADEPTTALDVTVQAQILRLIKNLQEEQGTSVLFITHDLGVVYEIADEVAVMYCGRVVESCSAKKLFSSTRYSHPYTEGLLASLPTLGGRKKLRPIEGSVPHPAHLPKGCKFSSRCPYRTQKCVDEEPILKEVVRGRRIRCHYPDKENRREPNR